MRDPAVTTHFWLNIFSFWWRKYFSSYSQVSVLLWMTGAH